MTRDLQSALTTTREVYLIALDRKQISNTRMNIIRQPIRKAYCPTCGCIFEWDKPHPNSEKWSTPVIQCPVCGQFIKIKDNTERILKILQDESIK